MLCWWYFPHAEDLVLNERRQTQVVKDVRAVAPDIKRAVLPQALIVEPVHLGDLPALVVASDEGYPVRVSHLRIAVTA